MRSAHCRISQGELPCTKLTGTYRIISNLNILVTTLNYFLSFISCDCDGVIFRLIKKLLHCYVDLGLGVGGQVEEVISPQVAELNMPTNSNCPTYLPRSEFFDYIFDQGLWTQNPVLKRSQASHVRVPSAENRIMLLGAR